MPLDFLKRATIAVYLKLLLRRIDALTAAVERQTLISERRLKLEAIVANVKLSQLDAIEEEVDPSPEKEEKKSSRPSMELLNQSAEEIDELNAAYAHAEDHFGKRGVPNDLDLYAYAASIKPDSPEEEV